MKRGQFAGWWEPVFEFEIGFAFRLACEIVKIGIARDRSSNERLKRFGRGR